jgi:hypothetical protein
VQPFHLTVSDLCREGWSEFTISTANRVAAAVQAYMAGASLPAFSDSGTGYTRGQNKEQAGNAAQTKVSHHLEAALLQLIQDPTLADPPQPNSQLPSPVQGPPLGIPCDLPEVQPSHQLVAMYILMPAPQYAII